MSQGSFIALALTAVAMFAVFVDVKTRRKRALKPFVAPSASEAASESLRIYCGLTFALMALFGVLRFL